MATDNKGQDQQQQGDKVRQLAEVIRDLIKTDQEIRTIVVGLVMDDPGFRDEVERVITASMPKPQLLEAKHQPIVEAEVAKALLEDFVKPAVRAMVRPDSLRFGA